MKGASIGISGLHFLVELEDLVHTSMHDVRISLVWTLREVVNTLVLVLFDLSASPAFAWSIHSGRLTSSELGRTDEDSDLFLCFFENA